MIDLNTAELQREGGAGAIPEDSIIPLKMTIRPPKAGKEGSTHAVFCRSGKGNEYIDVEFEALGTFAGRKVWQNFTLVGSDTAAKISMRTLRAIVESSRGISPSDASPKATAGRQLSDWLDFNDMTFLAKVGTVVEQSQKDGNYYVNNTIKKIVTPDDAEYQTGEFISDKPLPPIPAPGEAPPTAAKTNVAEPQAWGSKPETPVAPPTSGANGKGPDGPMPAWGSKPETPVAPPTNGANGKTPDGPMPAWAKR